MPNMTFPVSVKLWSTIYHLVSNGATPPPAMFIGWDDEDLPAVLPSSGQKPDEEQIRRETLRYETEGEVTVTDTTFTLTYEESEEMGMEGCRTVITFERNDPACLLMTRTGSASATMCFSMREPRQHCIYDTGIPGMPLDLCIRSRRVTNRITPEAGGTIHLDYFIAMRGVATERTVLRLEIKPL